MSSANKGKKKLGYQPSGNRGYQPSNSSESNKKPPAPINTPKGGSAGKKK